MPSHTVGLRRWISSSCSAEGVEVPEPAQLTPMPREAAQRENTCPTGWMPIGKEMCARSPRRAPAQSKVRAKDSSPTSMSLKLRG